MSPAPPNLGFKSEALRAALAAALAGRPAQLEDLLSRHGGYAAQPNLRLAAAFGAEVGALPGTVARLLDRLGANDAAPDTPQVFLPMAAAHGWVGRLRAKREVGPAWAALALLAGDERVPVRVATLDALVSYAARPDGADAILAHAADWLELEDRELRYGAAAVALEVFTNRQSLAGLDDAQPLFDYLALVLAEVAAAPRSAERSDARRRLLLSLPRAVAAAVAAFAAGEVGVTWLENQCHEARQPDLRGALSDSILALANKSSGQDAALVRRLRAALEGSAKPPRDPSRIRPGAARGKSTRPMR